MNTTDQFSANLLAAFAPTFLYLILVILIAIPLSVMAMRTKKGLICYVACIPFILIILFIFMNNCALHPECKGPMMPKISMPQGK